MSGGSYNYAYSKLDEFIFDFSSEANTPLRKAFLNHIQLVQKAMHDIEWVDSGDYDIGDDEQSIKNCLGENWKQLSVEAALVELDKLRNQLQELLDK